MPKWHMQHLCFMVPDILTSVTKDIQKKKTRPKEAERQSRGQHEGGQPSKSATNHRPVGLKAASGRE